MAKVSKVRKSDSRHKKVNSSLLASYPKKAGKGTQQKKCFEALEKRELENAKCSVCLEFPHNAVLLLCSSYDKGCRPYMCATSRRFSNCLEQYKKAYTTVTSVNRDSVDNSGLISGAGQSVEKNEVSELLCPLCRGQVKGWTVVEPVRKYLNKKKRSCMQDECSFVGTYKELKKHVRTKHPLARPRAVDPVLEEKWKKLENERARDDVISTIMSSTPGAVVFGDYVLEPGSHAFYRDDEYDSDDSLDDDFHHLDPSVRLHSRFIDYDLFEEADFGMHRAFRAISPAARTRPSRLLGSVGFRRIPWARGRNGNR